MFGKEAEALHHAAGCRAASGMHPAAVAAQRAAVRLLANELSDQLAGVRPSHVVEKALVGNRIVALWGASKTAALREELAAGAVGGGGAALRG